MPRRRQGDRVLGPYQDGPDSWRIILARASGEREPRFLPTKELADRAKAEIESQLVCKARTIDEAIDAYERYLSEKGNKKKSYEETVRRLRRFIGPDVGLAFSMLTPAWGSRCYERFRKTPLEDRRKPAESKPEEPPPPAPAPRFPSVDYHRNALAEARSFFAWCVAQRWTARNALADVKGLGRRKHGKAQLRIDEARKWDAKAFELAEEGQEGAACALATLYMQLRASEAIGLRVRDLDDGGRILWVDDSKTEAGRRQNEVPEHIRSVLLECAEGKPGDALLFGYHDRKWVNAWVKRICEAAGVPKVCAHSMRGLASSIGFARGMLGRAVADALGHEDPSTTETSYAKRDAVVEGKRQRGLTVLRGGGGQ